MSAARGMAAGPNSPRLHAHVAERARRLATWLASEGGPEWHRCPTDAVMALQLDAGCPRTALKTLRDAAALGLLEIWAPPGGPARMVRVTDAGMALAGEQVVQKVVQQVASVARWPGFADWLRQAKPGDRYPYYEGRLAEARDQRNCLPPLARVALEEAERASEAHALGLVLLTQQPLEGGAGTRYLASRTRKPLPRGAR
ncbi:hypothetical protein [Pseudoroseomonas cervicalis]|uniref:hypothetical protein n=1 Tax=Teichococcus cervicalis TaxID=204525 RepID=UPI0022F1C43B|nr:hypothetical protein [Pseudoroseomonas cervicalis]WBV42748.1 hypothetical protein PFY06_16110 [Pseudoroseomonas cervicalis]